MDLRRLPYFVAVAKVPIGHVHSFPFELSAGSSDCPPAYDS